MSALTFPNASDGKGGVRVWLKSSAYTRRLLLGVAGNPWISAAHYLAYFSQAHGLLKPDVAGLEVSELYDAWHAAHSGELAASLGKRRKPVTALRKLLEAEEPRQLLAEVVEAVLANLRGQTPLVLAVPSPRCWMNRVNQATGGADLDVTGDDVEDATMYLADLMRSVSTFPVSGVLLEEGRDDANFNVDDLARYTSIVNVVRHYRWSLVLRLPNGSLPAAETLGYADAVISAAHTAGDAAVWGRDITSAFNANAAIAPLSARQFYFAEIDPELRPESVLERLDMLRGK